MWFKKKSVLQAENHYDTEKSADGTTDLRTTFTPYFNTNSSITISGLPSAADANKYFYLPALGRYNNGWLNDVGKVGFYWSSSASARNNYNACDLDFRYNSVEVYDHSRISGYRVEALQ